jgi:hypothetical protein
MEEMKALHAVLAAVIMLVLVPGSPAGAASGSTASCVMKSLLSFSPGITGTSPRKVASSTHGETGMITCVGKVNGHDATGAGTIGFDGLWDLSCLGGKGTETVSLTIPTAAGPQKFTFSVNETVVPPAGYKTGGPFVGPVPFVFYPTKGDCVTSPITELGFAASAALKT